MHRIPIHWAQNSIYPNGKHFLPNLIKNKVQFPRVIKKKNMEFPGVFVFGLGISKGSNTILWNIQGLSFVLSGISRVKVNKWKIGLKNISSASPVWTFSGIAQYLIYYVKFNMWPALFYVNSLCFPNIFKCWC